MQKDEEISTKPHVNQRNTLQTSSRRMIPLVRSPFSKHKYDLERNKMRKEIGWLWDNMKGESARVSLR